MRRAQQADPTQNERNEGRVRQEEIRSGNNSDNENERNNEGENANDKKVKKKRVVNRLTFKQDHLMDSTKGLRSLYEWVNKLKLETFDNKKEVNFNSLFILKRNQGGTIKSIFETL